MNCWVCGSEVRVYSADEGTQSYEPVHADMIAERDAAVQALAERIERVKELEEGVKAELASWEAYGEGLGREYWERLAGKEPT